MMPIEWQPYSALFNRLDKQTRKVVEEAITAGLSPCDLHLTLVLRFGTPNTDLGRVKEVSEKLVNSGCSNIREFPVTQAVGVSTSAASAFSAMSHFPDLIAESDLEMGVG